MKLNFDRERIETDTAEVIKSSKSSVEHLMQDWLTLSAECTRRGELIEQLEKALKTACHVFHKSMWEDNEIEAVQSMQVCLTVISEWRKEQDANRADN